jgi:hypothetical protein
MDLIKKILGHLVIIASLLLASCGYVSDKPVQNSDVYKSDELQTCKIDVTKLSEIFKADQKQQIKCLQDNFIQFTKYVRSKNPGTVNENELGIFVKKFFEGQSDSIIKGLSIIFQLNMILLKDEADRISNTNISPLFELLIQINQEAVIITDILKQMDDVKNQGRFWELKDQFHQSIKRFATTAIKLIDKSPGISKKLNIRKFILKAGQKLGNKPIDEDTVDSLIFIKQVLLAGDEEEVISTDELKVLIGKLPNLLSMVFDVYYVTNENFENDANHIKFYLDTINELYETIHFNQDDFVLVTSDQLAKLADQIFPGKNVTRFKATLEIYKQKLLGGSPTEITLSDLKTALDIGKDLTERMYFNDVTYVSAKEKLEQPEAIKEFDLRMLNEYKIFSTRRLKELHNSFFDIAVNFRYFRNKTTGANYYGKEIKRNKYGFHEAALSKWLAIKLVNAYGKKDENGIGQVSIDDFNLFLKDSKPLLEEFNLWSENMDTFAQNSVLLADLFQQQSNGDFKIGINEATEYISMIMSAVQVSGKVNTELTAVCPYRNNKEQPEFEKECFNEHFFDVLLNKLDYKNSMPNLNRYIEDKTTTKEEIIGYLNGVEGFARDKDEPKYPIDPRDSTLIFGAMLNIESTFIRFDLNDDNIIDYNELSKAFVIYKKSIIEIAELKPDQEQYALPAFLYMVTKMKAPPRGRLIEDAAFAVWAKCATNDFCRKSIMDEMKAKRLNIGKLLHNLILMRDKKKDEAPKVASEEASKKDSEVAPKGDEKNEPAIGKKRRRLWNVKWPWK